MKHLSVIALLLLMVGVMSCRRTSVPASDTQQYHSADSVLATLQSVDELRAIADSAVASGDQIEEMLAMNYLGKLFRDSSRFRPAIDAHSRGLELATRLGDTTEMVRALNNLGTDFRRMGILEEASSFHYAALGLCEKQLTGNASRQVLKNRVRSLNGIANIMLTLGNTTLADSMLRMALRGERQLGSALGQAINLANMGSIKETLGQTDSAWYYYRRSMEMNQEAGSDVGIALCHINYGQLYEKSGSKEQARKEYEQAYRLLSTVGDVWHRLGAVQALARVAIATGNVGEARRFIAQSNNDAHTVGSAEHQAETYRLQYELALREGDARAALRYHLLSDSVLHSMTNGDNMTHMQEERINYERARQQEQVDLVTANYRNEQRVHLLIVCLLALLLLLGAGFIVLMRMRTRAQLVRTQLQVEQLLGDLDRIRHRLGVGVENADHDNLPAHAATDGTILLDSFNSAVERSMEQHQPLDVEQIASDMAMTGSQLRRRVRALTGLTPLAYANSLRMARARRLLGTHPEMSISDVADRCGFYDVAYFSKMFKQVYQITPTQCRDANV